MSESNMQMLEGMGEEYDELARARDELAAAKAYMENIIGSMADMLLVINPDMTIGAVNRALLNLLGYTEEDLVGTSPSEIFGQELADGSIMETLFMQGSVSNVETTYLTKDRQIIPVSLSGSLMQDDNGTIQGLVCVAQDITERKRIEEERRQMNDRLVETSRQLGMADVATSVLHNVGNVLNSINVSVGLMGKTLRQSLVEDVSRISKMLNDHLDDLGTFLTTDKKGKQIPAYLTQLAEHLLEERRVTLSELESLNGSTEHAKQCVAMQQGMAKAGGLYESVIFADLVEQAVMINKEGLDSLQVVVTKNFIDIPEVMIDKHQVLQILVNLIRNAGQAMQAATRRELTLSISQPDKSFDMFSLEVTDTGAGIHPDNLPRVFAQGFTTKKDGHGFGLHSGALLAKNMGGTLSVRSDGEGTGATFTLILPVAVETASNHLV